MKEIPSVKISEYTYELPEERIAVYPLSERDKSKLLIWKNGHISETLFENIDMVIPGKSLMVFNNTRVIHARLSFRRATGARIEIFCLEPHHPADYQISFRQTAEAEWKCLVGNAKKWKGGILEQAIQINGENVTLKAEMTERRGNAFIIRFSWDKSFQFSDIIGAAGNIPIPPYLNRMAEESDNTRYQTLYAKIDGSVAAPTAGLHFTEKVLKKLALRGVTTAELTLHVGAGTFQPVKSEVIAGHEMHTETVIVTKSLVESLLANRTHVVAVGTTSVRSLESLYWLGADPERLNAETPIHVGQWEPYLCNNNLPAETALKNLLRRMEFKQTDYLSFTTSVIIVPGYHFQIINSMITNFHQPQSTLLLLIAAFLGHGWKEVYDYALRHDFRFLSYGDSNIYLKSEQPTPDGNP